MSRDEAATILTAVEAHRTGAATWGTDTAATTAASAVAGAAGDPSLSPWRSPGQSQDQAVLLEAVRTAAGMGGGIIGSGGGDNDERRMANGTTRGNGPVGSNPQGSADQRGVH